MSRISADPGGALGVLLEELHAHALLLEQLRAGDPELLAPQDEDALELARPLEPHELHDVQEVLPGAQHVEVVPDLHLHGAVGNDHLAAAKDESDERVLRGSVLLQLDRGCFPASREPRSTYMPNRRTLPVRELVDVGDPGEPDHPHDLLRQLLLGVDDEVDLETRPPRPPALHSSTSWVRIRATLTRLLRVDLGDQAGEDVHLVGDPSPRSPSRRRGHPPCCRVRTREALPSTTWASSVVSSSSHRSGFGVDDGDLVALTDEPARGECSDLSAPADEHAHGVEVSSSLRRWRATSRTPPDGKRRGGSARRASTTSRFTAAELGLVLHAAEGAGDQPADLLHLRLLHPAGGQGRGADADPRGHHGLVRVEGDRVLVDGDPGLRPAPSPPPCR